MITWKRDLRAFLFRCLFSSAYIQHMCWYADADNDDLFRLILFGTMVHAARISETTIHDSTDQWKLSDFHLFDK